MGKKTSRARWLRKFAKLREGEGIDTGFFVACRDEQTGRARFAPRAFEHPTLVEAIAEAERLAGETPGRKFEVYGRAHTITVSGTPSAEPEAEAAE